MITDWPADPADIRIGSLFSGYGGLEMGVQRALGGRTAWHCEFDKDPSAILAHHWPGVPNFGDITKVDWSTVERVHVLTGGSPCQDVSTAGSRKGMKAGTRSGLWAAMVDAIEALRPPIVVWENVRGVTSAEANCDVELCPGCVGDDSGVYLRALGRVLGDLADLGYDAQWYGIRAADIGAPHGRFRIFVVAVDADTAGLRQAARDGDGGRARGARQAGQPETSGDATAADADGARRGTRRAGRTRQDGRPVAGRRTAADREGDQQREPAKRRVRPEPGHGPHAVVTAQEAGIDFGEFTLAIRRWELILGRLAPAPVERAVSKKYPEGRWVLSPAFAEWMMGLPAGHVSDPAIDLSRGARLKACGNGVVPQQAAAAIGVCMIGLGLAHLLLLHRQAAPAVESQACRSCGESKPLEAFGFNTHNGKRTPRGVCRTCRAAGRKAATHTQGSTS